MNITKKDFAVSLAKMINYVETDEAADYHDGLKGHIYLDIVKVRDYMLQNPDYKEDFGEEYLPQQYLKVSNPHGEFIVDPSTGKVVFKNLSDDAGSTDRKIVKFDLEEWKKYYNKELPEEVYSLDLGCWLEDGRYLQANTNHREPQKAPPKYDQYNKKDCVVIGSSHGHFYADLETGKLVRRNICCDKKPDEYCSVEYTLIKKFDLEEWKRFYRVEVSPHIDILDLGYWLDNGDYIPAEDDHRKEVLEYTNQGGE